MDTSKLSPSPTRHYVIPVYNSDFTKVSFREFKLPEQYENTCAKATWYFYAQDAFSCGGSAYPWHMHTNVVEIAPGFVMDQGEGK